MRPGTAKRRSDTARRSSARGILSIARHFGPIHAVVGHSVGAAAALLATRFGLRASAFALIAPPVGPNDKVVPFVDEASIAGAARTADLVERFVARVTAPASFTETLEGELFDRDRRRAG